MKGLLITLLLCLGAAGFGWAEAPAKAVAYLDPKAAGADYLMQGEYEGTMREKPFALQVLAMGKGGFDAVVRHQGLPGKAAEAGKPQRVSGVKTEEGMSFSGNGWRAQLSASGIALTDFKGGALGHLQRVERSSPTLGAKPPAGAVLLFDGSSVEALRPGAQMTPDGLLMEGCTTKEEFGDCSLHIEFRLPFVPEARGQGRGNSGLYVAGRYEVQMLDSFGLSGEKNECGGIYSVAQPMVNMCYPPLTWQTYDIDYTAPRFDEQGMKLSDATLVVRHNGVLIHDGVKVPHCTTAAPISKEGPRGYLHLQNHGNPVRYRNFWVLRKD
jgi:hypothetical protein